MLRGEPPAPLPDISDGVTINHLRAAAMIDPEPCRTLSSILTMLRKPADVLTDPDVRDHVRAAFANGNIAAPPPGPSRADILAAFDPVGIS